MFAPSAVHKSSFLCSIMVGWHSQLLLKLGNVFLFGQQNGVSLIGEALRHIV